MGIEMTTKQTRRLQQATQHNGQAQARAQATMTVSQETLDLLVEGRNALLQQRQQIVQDLQEIDTLIQRQEGGIQLMQTLLEGQTHAATEKQLATNGNTPTRA
jgi:hypothetical protein